VQISKTVSQPRRVFVVLVASRCQLSGNRLATETKPANSVVGVGESGGHMIVALPQHWTSRSSHCGWLVPDHFQLRHPARVCGDVWWRWTTLTSIGRALPARQFLRSSKNSTPFPTRTRRHPEGVVKGNKVVIVNVINQGKLLSAWNPSFTSSGLGAGRLAEYTFGQVSQCLKDTVLLQLCWERSLPAPGYHTGDRWADA